MLNRYVILANPGSKRWELYSQELHHFWEEQQDAAEIHLLPWIEVLNQKGDLSGFPEFEKSALVRLESPGRDFEVTKALLQLGDPAQSWDELPYRKGHLLQPGALYRGFCNALQRIDETLKKPHLLSLCDAGEVMEVFDKNATLSRFRTRDLPCPESLTPPEKAEELLQMLRAQSWKVTYVKLATGSSASGIAVVRACDREPGAITSVVELEDGFYNTRRLRTVRGQDLRNILQFILDQGSTVQRGIPMAQLEAHNFDVRVLLIHGKIELTMFRLSTMPMTNLHLGGRRGEEQSCKQSIPRRVWLDAMDSCREVAKLYPGSSILGIDLVFERGYGKHYLLEVNAFGDFFPGWTNDQDKSAHRIEIEASAKKLRDFQTSHNFS